MSHETPKNSRSPRVETYHDGNGVRVRRRSSDSCWPLRRADRRTWAEAKASATARVAEEQRLGEPGVPVDFPGSTPGLSTIPQDTCEHECEIGKCVCAP